MLVDVLALTNPIAFGRANRLKRLVGDVADRIKLSDRWQLEVAAMLSQLGAITLPAETVEKLYFGHASTSTNSGWWRSCPRHPEELLANIPRLEGRAHDRRLPEGADPHLRRAAGPRRDRARHRRPARGY